MNIEQGIEMLSRQGLNLFAVLRTARLTDAFNTTARQANIALEDYPSLVLIGHGGNLMWQRLKHEGGTGPDPVDEFSTYHARCFVDQYLDRCRHLLLYPGAISIPLQQLGSLAGWHHRSPLGLGVHDVYGPWFGYRAALLVQVDMPERVAPVVASPCRQCTGKPCISTCPANALTAAAPPNVSACADYRMQDRSPCARLCKARLACPVGSDFRYGSEQLGYFYRRSLNSIRAYLAGGDG